MSDAQVSSQVINDVLRAEGDYFFTFIHVNSNPAGGVTQHDEVISSPFGDALYSYKYNSIGNDNHGTVNGDLTIISQDGNVFHVETHYTATSSGAFNFEEKSFINGVEDHFHYNSNAFPTG